MTKICFVLPFLLMGLLGQSQNLQTDIQQLQITWQIDSTIQQHATYLAENDSLMGLVMKNIAYPDTENDTCLWHSKIYVALLINEIGRVNETKVLKSICPSIDEQFINLMKGLTFKPAIKNGKAVKDLYYFPLQICLRSK